MEKKTQEFRALHRYAHISPSKVRPVANLVRGLPVNAALIKLRMCPRRGAFMLRKVLESAVANANQAEDAIRVNRLMVKSIWADQAGLLQSSKRWRPGPMGRAMPIRKRMAHLGVIVAEMPEEGKE